MTWGSINREGAPALFLVLFFPHLFLLLVCLAVFLVSLDCAGVRGGRGHA